MSINIRVGVGERSKRVFNFPIAARGDFGLGLIVVGRVIVDASKYRAISARFSGQAQCSEVGLSGTVKLFDVTDGDVELLSVPIVTDQPTDFETAVPIDPTQLRTFEVRAGLDGPGPYTDTQVLINWFGTLELTTVF